MDFNEIYSSSELVPKVSSSGQNQIRVVNPNPNGQVVPLEDLFIYVSLKAKQKSKSVLTSTDNGLNVESETRNNIELVAPQEVVEVVNGQNLFRTKQQLTTDWTEIGNPNRTLGVDFEGFGITNVDIEIKSQTTPVVTIDFVDVRGATLFEQGSCSPYALFFNLPYPIFELTLKGYYGRPVTYYLNLTNFNCKFNSQNGNMECRGKFIGYTFAFLSDMIMGYVSAAQYLDDNRYNVKTKLYNKYLNTKVNYLAQGLDSITDISTPTPWCGNNVTGDGCMTIMDLIKSIEKFEKDDKPAISNSPEYYEWENLVDLEKHIKNYAQSIRTLITELSAKYGDGIFKNSLAYGNGKTVNERIVLVKTDEQSAIVGGVKDYLNTFFNKKNSVFLDYIKTIKTKEISKNGVYGDTYTKLISGDLTKTDIDNNLNVVDAVYDKLYSDLTSDENVRFQAGLLTEYKDSKDLEDLPKPAKGSYVYLDLGYLIKAVEDTLVNLNDINHDGDNNIPAKRAVITEAVNNIVESRIGFKPTIRNVFTVILCNTDTLVDILLDVQTKAEEYHNANTKPEDANFVSGAKKIYPWPTYVEKSYTSTDTGKVQGEKEVYPGKRFPNWVECRFVEDFLIAFKKFQEDREIINQELEGKVSYDNYIPINPLESPLWFQDKPIKYFEIHDKETTYKIIGERAFINLDHSYMSPIRTTKDMLKMPIFYKDANWNPIKNSYTSQTDIPAILGKLDAWNLLNSKDSGDKIGMELKMLINNVDETKFVEDVLKTFGDKLQKDVKASTIYKLSGQTFDSGKIGFSTSDDYYVLNEEYISLHGDNDVKIYANPHKMDPNHLINFIDAPQGNPLTDIRPITITNNNFLGHINTFEQNLTKTTNSIKFGTSEIESLTEFTSLKIGDFEFVKEWYVTSLSKPQNFTTLAMSKVKSGGLTEWYKSSNADGISPSNMGLISYWDYSLKNETLGISFLCGDNNQNDIFDKTIPGWDVNMAKLVNTSTPLISTPLWLDNVNKFREGVMSTKPRLRTDKGGVNLDNDDKIQNRNLAYLFLHTLKTTPLITRYINNKGYLYGSDSGDNPSQQSFIQSLRAFMINSGMAKVPKAWLLTLGAQLWRWKMFVGTKTVNGKTVWNKPLPCLDSYGGDKPNGFDPLSQPGFNTIYDNNFKRLNNKKDPKIQRNNIPQYMGLIYGITPSVNSIQRSVFDYDYQGRLKGKLLDGGGDIDSYASFKYYNAFKTKMGRLEKYLKPSTKNQVALEYSWAQLWIAPHHIPYVNPEIFFDKGEGEASAFVLAFENGVDYLDYQTIMPTNWAKTEYFDGSSLYTGEDNTKRSRSLDGNLGMVLQYIPDSVKDKIVTYFETWVDSEWKDTLLPIVDPVNFGNTSTSIETTYDYDKDISSEVLGNENSSYALVLKKDDTNTKLLTQKLFTDQVWITSSTPKIWYGIGDETQNGSGSKNNQFNDSFLVSKKTLETYLKAFYNEFKSQIDVRIAEVTKKEIENADNGDSIIDDDDVKLSLYRFFKSLSDKWISASKPGTNFFSLVGLDSNCSQNYKYKKQNNGDEKQKTLANNFQYVNRAMGDIGDEAVINITKLTELIDNPKISLYQYITDLLTQNEYMFFPLPAYINMTNGGLSNDDLVDMFRPVNSFSKVGCGPLFLSMYVGGNSRQLDMSSYGHSCHIDNEILQSIQNDSWHLTGYGNLNDSPDEFQNQELSKGITVFEVLYGTENQSHFKNIQLDQAEFKETAESLLVIDKLSKQGGSDRTTKGQNLNTAYLTRSYTCEIESLGNMMIQPMTYFDLKGVPMFHGSYLITEVRHNFKPNNATTTFKGVRQPRMTLPIVTDVSVAMNLSFKGSEKGDGSGRSIKGYGGTVTDTSGAKFGTNCGNYSVDIPGSVSNSDEFIKTKPIRDLVAVVESGNRSDGYDSYNYYSYYNSVRDNKLVSVIGSTGSFRPSTLTIGEIKQKQTSKLQLFAVGKYQLIPDTFIGATKALNISDSELYDEKNQEKLGWWLISGKGGGRPGLKKYFTSVGSEEEIQKAITDLALEFASFPSYHGVNAKQAIKYENPLGYNSKTALYGGLGGNAATAKFCAEDVAKALIQTWTNLNGKSPQFTFSQLNESTKQNKIPSSCNQGTTITIKGIDTKAVVIGSSSVGTLSKTSGTLINNPKNTVSVGPNCVGGTVKTMIEMLEQDNSRARSGVYEYRGVKVLYLLGIGTNDGYKDLGVSKLNDLINQKFPNAKKVILPGTYGWGNVSNKTKDDQDKYYKLYQDLGWVYDYPSGVSAYAKDDGEAHNPNSDWFKALVTLMNKYYPV